MSLTSRIHSSVSSFVRAGGCAQRRRSASSALRLRSDRLSGSGRTDGRRGMGSLRIAFGQSSRGLSGRVAAPPISFPTDCSPDSERREPTKREATAPVRGARGGDPREEGPGAARSGGRPRSSALCGAVTASPRGAERRPRRSRCLRPVHPGPISRPAPSQRDSIETGGTPPEEGRSGAPRRGRPASGRQDGQSLDLEPPEVGVIARGHGGVG